MKKPMMKKNLKLKGSWEDEEEEEFEGVLKSVEMFPICIECEHLGIMEKWYHKILPIEPRYFCFAQGFRSVNLCYGSRQCKGVYESQLKLPMLATHGN